MNLSTVFFLNLHTTVRKRCLNTSVAIAVCINIYRFCDQC